MIFRRIAVIVFILSSLRIQSIENKLMISEKIETVYLVYEKFGKITKKVNYIIIYDYDEESNIYQTENYDSNNKLKYKYLYKYDNNHNMIESIFISNNKINYKYQYVYKYDEKNRIIERIKYDSNEKIAGKCIYNYYFDDSLVELLEYSSNNELINKESYSYSNKNLIETKIYDKDYNLHYSILNKYDKFNNKIESDYIYEDIIKNKYTYRYDANGNVIEISKFKGSNDLIYKEIIKYNNNNDKIEQSQYTEIINKKNNKEFKLKEFITYKYKYFKKK